MASQVVLGGVRREGVGVLVVGVLAAVVCGRLAGQGDAGVVVGVDGLAEVDGVLELLLQHLPARVPWQLEQEEAGVRLGQEVVRWVVLVQDLKHIQNLSKKKNLISSKTYCGGHVKMERLLISRTSQVDLRRLV